MRKLIVSVAAVAMMAAMTSSVLANDAECQAAFGDAHANNSRWYWTGIPLSEGSSDPTQSGVSGNVVVEMGGILCVPTNPGGNLVYSDSHIHYPQEMEGGEDVKICQNSNIGQTRYSTLTDEGAELGYTQQTCTDITGYDAHPS